MIIPNVWIFLFTGDRNKAKGSHKLNKNTLRMGEKILQTKQPTKDHLTSFQNGHLKKSGTIIVGAVEKRNPCTLLVGEQIGAAIMENHMEVLKH